MPIIDERESRPFVQELKFLIPVDTADAVREWARARLSPDPHAGGVSADEYRVTSLYLDTADFAVFDRRGSYGRSKYRVRRYGESNRVFLERKLKTKNRVGKLRSIVNLTEIEMLEYAAVGGPWAGRWFQRRVKARELRPVCQISYLRTARMGMSDTGPVRLTVDRDIRALPVNGYRFAGTDEGTVLSPDLRILELKYKLEIPGVFKQLMQEFNLRPVTSSKYRLAVESLELKQGALCLSS